MAAFDFNMSMSPFCAIKAVDTVENSRSKIRLSDSILIKIEFHAI